MGEEAARQLGAGTLKSGWMGAGKEVEVREAEREARTEAAAGLATELVGQSSGAVMGTDRAVRSEVVTEPWE